MKKELILCDCHEHALAISEDVLDPDGTNDGPLMSVDFGFWQYGQNPTSLRQRIRYIWHILRHGTPYTDTLVFNYDSIREIRNHLNQILIEYEGNHR